jgi:hypothetical protein
MDDVNATIRGLHPDRFERIAAVTGTLANGFAAAQGAAALLGGESEGLQKAMVRMQGLMAFSQGIAGLKEMKQVMGGMGGTIKSQLIPAFTSLAGAARAVGAALGIGLIIGGITMLIGLIQKLDLSIDGVAKSDKKLLESQQERLKASQDQVDALDASDNILKAQGKSEKEILQMKIAALNVTISNQKAVIETSKAQADAQYAAAKRNKDILVGILKFINAPIRGILSAVDSIAEKLGYKTGLLSQFDGVIEGMASMAFDPEETKKESDKDIAEMEKGLLAMENKLAGHKLAIKAIDDNAAKEAKAARDKAAADAQAARDKELADEKAQTDAMIKASQDRYNRERAEADKRNAMNAAKRKAELDAAAQKEKEHADFVKKLQDAVTQNQIDNANATAENRRSIESSVSQSLGALSSLFAQGSAAQKAFALAQIAADSGAAIAAALRNSQSPTPDNAATGGLAGIAKFAAIAAVILTNSARAVQIVKSGKPGGNMQAPSPAGGGGFQRPVLPASSTLGGGSQMAGQWDNRVYVTEGDITGTQRRVNMLRGASVI